MNRIKINIYNFIIKELAVNLGSLIYWRKRIFSFSFYSDRVITEKQDSFLAYITEKRAKISLYAVPSKLKKGRCSPKKKEKNLKKKRRS